MAVRQIVMGGIAGEIISLAYEEMVRRSRVAQLMDYNTYNHKDPSFDTDKYVDIYKKELAGDTAGDSHPGAHPEDTCRSLSIERVIIEKQYDGEPQSEGGTCKVTEALVILRRPRWDGEPTYRLKIKVVDNYASNGNGPWRTTTIGDAKLIPQEELETDALLKELCPA